MLDRQWVILRFRGDFPYLVVRYSDSSGQRAENRLDWSPAAKSEESYFNLLGPLELKSRIRDLTGRSGTLPIPVYLDFGNLWLDKDRDSLAQHPRMQNEIPEVETVLLSRARPLRRAPFRLPLRILVVGAADIELGKFRNRRWLNQAQGSGIRVHSCEPDDLARTLRGAGDL